MRQRLLLVVITCALLLGGWSGVLASVLCPHAGSPARVAASIAPAQDASNRVHAPASSGQETHECCRAKLRTRARTHDEQPAAHDAHDASHTASHTGHGATTPSFAHDAHAPTQTASLHAEHQTHAATKSRTSSSAPVSANVGDCAAHRVASGDRSIDAPAYGCAHCVSRSERTPVPFIMREPNDARRDARDAPPRAEKTPAPLASTFIPDTFPRMGAPPPGSATRRHLLNSIFLI